MLGMTRLEVAYERRPQKCFARVYFIGLHPERTLLPGFLTYLNANLLNSRMGI